MPVQPRIPVVMYHSVGERLDSWLWPDLTISAELFEKQIKLLKANGYRSLFLDELYERQTAGVTGKEKEVVLTFDDGYLDNWVFAYPILKKHGWRGTIYVNPEFIDPSEDPRLTLEDVWAGKCAMEDLTVHGFLNRAELRLLQESGVMEIGSHSMSHTWYPTSASIKDFHRPDLDTPWLAWNAQPERKHAYLIEDQSGFVEPGYPIHTHGRSLGIRRYIPSVDLAEFGIKWAADKVRLESLSSNHGRADLLAAIEEFGGDGRFESDEEMINRFEYEIVESKKQLEEIIGKEVPHFCWPGGAYCAESWPLAEKAGHQTICVARRDKVRWSADDPKLVRRIGSNDFVTFRGKRYATENPRFLLWACNIELGASAQRWPMRIAKVMNAIKSRLTS
ncbi:MAG: peptidoglycan/xylan/chitin deacetylase (PgdA/CDA1 family) [Candidatus Krumholzibacteriia bacterium]|jgi:peptidoglycan/xylan/chitin deacetylase (PgdA/CDA1 family)